MASTGGRTPSKPDKATLSLKEQAHQQMMDLLRVAEKSSHPEIRTAAVEMAKDTLHNQQRQTARLSPTLILFVLLASFIGTVLACWYAFLYHSEIAYQLSGISVILFIVIAAIVLSLAGNLSESSLMKVLMKVLDSATSYAKNKLGLSRKPSSDGPIELQANADDDDPSLKK